MRPGDPAGQQARPDQVATPPIGTPFAAPVSEQRDESPPPAADAQVLRADLVVEPEPTRPPVDDAADDDDVLLLDEAEVLRFRDRWRELQADFVDDPRASVRGADQLVGEVVAALAKAATERRQALGDGRPAGGDETEHLRLALRRYRSFLDQLLSSSTRSR